MKRAAHSGGNRPFPKIAILGAGAVVREYHLPALTLLGFPRDRLRVFDVSKEALTRLGRARPGIRTHCENFKDPRAMERIRATAEAVLIALPNALHEGAVERALAAGLHVLCEKPLAMSEKGCLRLGDLAHRSGKLLAVGMARRFVPAFLSIRRAALDARWGALRGIELEFGGPYAWLSESGAYFRPESGGVLSDMGVHFLDYAALLCGRLKPLSYRDDWRGGVEANAFYELQSETGVSIRLGLSRTRRLREAFIFRFEGGDATMEKDNFSEYRFTPRGGSPAHLEGDRQDPGWDPRRLESAFAYEWRSFFAGTTEGRCELPGADEAAHIMALVEWAYAHRRKSGVAEAAASATARDRVLVTGGTGFIGSKLVERLCGKGGADVTVPVRNYFTCAEIARFPVSMPKVDLLDPAEVRRALRGIRHVFHLAYGRDGWESSRVTVEGTKNVVRAAIENGAESVVVLSSIYVFGRPDTAGPIDESYPYRPIGAYGRSKAEMERWCLRTAKTSSTRIVVLNPSCVYGPGGTTYTRLPLHLAQEGRFCWVNGGTGTANYVYIDNLIDAMLSALTAREIQGKRLIITDGHCAWKEFLEPFLGPYAVRTPFCDFRELAARRDRRASFRAWVKDLPFASSLRPVWRALRTIPPGQKDPEIQRGSGSEPSSAPAWLADLFHPAQTVFAAQRAHDVLGWRPRVSLREGQKRTVEWLRENGDFKMGTSS